MAVEATKPIFSAFLVVHFDEEEEVKGKVRAPKGPVIDYSWPSGDLLTDDEKLKIKRAAVFAVPFQGYDVPKEAVEVFTFTLTSEKYVKTYGFCRYSPALGKCLCILSNNQWFEFFYSLLDHMARHVVEKDKDPEPVCQRLAELELKETGSLQEITLTELGLGIWKVPEIPSPSCLPKLNESKNLLEYYSATSNSSETMIAIFTLLLLERGVVFFASKLGRLTACIHAATSLLYPLSWQHVIVPIVPSEMLLALHCPTSAIFGVVKGLRPEVHRMFKSGMGDNLVEVDLDTNEIFCPEDMELQSLPSPVYHMLNDAIKSMTMDRKGRLRKDPWHNDNFARCFMDAIVALIGDYRRGFSVKVDDNSVIDQNFNSESFFQSRPDDYRPFLEKLVATHVFQLFFDNRLKNLNIPKPSLGDDPFEKAVKEFVLPPTTKFKINLKDKSKKFADKISKVGQDVHGAGINAIGKFKQRVENQRSGSNRNKPQRSGSVPELSDVKIGHESTATLEVACRYDVIAIGDNEDSELFKTTSLLDDPELQTFLRKSKSLEDMLDDEVPPQTPPPPPSDTPFDISPPSSSERPRPRALTREAPVLPKPQRPPPPLPDQRPLSQVLYPPSPSEVQPRPKPRAKLRQTLEPMPPPPVDPILQDFDPLCNAAPPRSDPMPDVVMSARPFPDSVYFSAFSDTFHTPRSSMATSLLDKDSPPQGDARDSFDPGLVHATWLAQQKSATVPPVPKPRGSASSASKWETFEE